MALSTAAKVFLGVAGVAAVGGAVMAARKPKTKKKKKKTEICPQGQVQLGTNRDGTILCGPASTFGREPDSEPPTWRPSGVATVDVDVPVPAPEDPYAGLPWTEWPQPVHSQLAGYTCPVGHVMAYRGILPDGTPGGCGEDEFDGETWCIPPWGAIRRCGGFGDDCDVGLTFVQVADGDTLRKVCRNIPSS